jgi:hypothetical protein
MARPWGRPPSLLPLGAEGGPLPCATLLGQALGGEGRGWWVVGVVCVLCVCHAMHAWGPGWWWWWVEARAGHPPPVKFMATLSSPPAERA